ncbi:helix-turn-helix domain-containing protein [Photorhabdus sp. APURE]|uniref:XRE family transcriptional regulator n=1 Tax=Photorhabdus luminescens subsp. mexicana TaxID=2100167 RepID=A0A4R4INK4_PHOLU|nr:helix-turn-helix domain-containing protein [Photorhabdus aballayi]TDB42114.1 XRE family transcriptional regulator [Photorhabdus luminescens subsp. mexicana]
MKPKRLVAARKGRNLSQQALGKALGVIDSEQARKKIGRYETGAVTPTYETACQIAKILNVPECYFYIDDDLFAIQVLTLYENNFSSDPIIKLKEKNQEYKQALKDIKRTINSLEDL